MIGVKPMRYFDKDYFLEKTKEAMVAYQDEAMRLIQEGKTKEAEFPKAARNIFICYRTTYSAHWYDRYDEEALQQFINYDMTVQTGHIAKTQEEMQAILDSDVSEGIKQVALAKHRGYMALLKIFEESFQEE